MMETMAYLSLGVAVGVLIGVFTAHAISVSVFLIALMVAGMIFAAIGWPRQP